VADHRELIDRVMHVVSQRLEQAERIGLQKLEEVERRGREEVAKAERKHRQKMRKLDRRRSRIETRHRRQSGNRRGNAGGTAVRDGDTARRQRREKRRSRTLSAEEKSYRAARRRANLRLAFYTHFAVFISVIMLLIVTTRSFRVAAIVALSWGVAVFLHYFWTIVAPDLRERWVQKEVGQRVDGNVSSERRKVENRHVRSLEDLSASIAHEIRNPITAAKSLVQQMGEDPGSGTNLEYAGVALEELDRVERSISHLLRFARDEDLRFVDLEMADVVHSALDTFRERIARMGVAVDCQLDTQGSMRGDPEQLRRVVINLIGNAIDAMEGAGTAEPKLTIMSGDNLAGTEVWVRLQDNGPGIPVETRAKIFDPFFTTKSSGTGLGLALSKKVVDAHGGCISVESSPQHGTEFVLSFPKDSQLGGGSA
jgi:signal transduction histidine kinase